MTTPKMLNCYPTINILGMNISAMKKGEIIAETIHTIKSRKRSYICLSNVYSTILFQKNEKFRKAILCADIVIADGLPLAWVSSLKGQKIERIRGTDLMLALCQLSHKHNFSHFFYGGEPDIPGKLVEKLKKKFPWLNVSGIYSPPFRPLTDEEDQKMCERINEANPDILWVALGNPKQEIWMYEHRSKLNVPVMIGVGAAFDFLSGNVKQAPKWVQNSGFEWFFRLAHEPRRLWKRYLLGNTIFLFLVVLDLLKTKAKLHHYVLDRKEK